MENIKKIPVILDGDPGHDDAIAWVVAKASPVLDIRAVTTVCGNQTLEKTTYNAQRICTLIGLDAPIAKGRPRPLFTDPMVAPNVHGQTGLDGPVLPEPKMDVQDISAVELMARTLRESDEKITLIPTGPLTTIASLLLTHPELKDKIAHIYMMGGGIAYGNWTPAAEFNVYVDPEAADMLFASGIPVVMCGLDVTLKAKIMPPEIDILAEYGPQGSFLSRALKTSLAFTTSLGFDGVFLHDVCPIFYCVEPELFTTELAGVRVETKGRYTAGKTVTDLYSDYQFDFKNTLVVLDVDREAFVEKFMGLMAKYGRQA